MESMEHLKDEINFLEGKTRLYHFVTPSMIGIIIWSI